MSSSPLAMDASLRTGWSDSGGSWRFEMPDHWGQGRSVYGGLTAAAAVALARPQVDSTRALRTLHVQFLRPTTPGPVEGRFALLREGRSTSFAQCSLLQDGAPTLLANLVFALPRPEATTVAPEPAPAGPAPASLQDLPYIPGVVPEFTQHLAIRWASGAVPFSGAAQARFSGYCRFRGPASDIEGVIGLLDAWPCPSLSVLPGPAMASSVTWTAHILHVPEVFDGWFAFTYETVAGGGGMHTSVGRLHAPDGRLVARTEQLVAVFG